MKTKKYQFFNRFLVRDPVTERNIFAFREFKKTACWIMVNPREEGSQSENCRVDLDQILNDFARKPILSEARLRQYLTLIRKGLKNSTNSQSPPPGMLMMVTDYSRIVWAIAGDLRIYWVRNGKLKFEDDEWGFMNCLGINFKPGEVRSNSAFLKDNDLIFLCNDEIGQKISDEFLYRAITDVKNSDESVERAKHFLIDASQDPDYRMAFISVSKVQKRDFSHDLQGCKRTEVMIPVLLMACFGMLAIYEIETQKLKHALFISNTIATHQEQLTDRKSATEIPLQETKNVEQSGPKAAATDQGADNVTSEQSSTLTGEPVVAVLPQTDPSKDSPEEVPGKAEPVTTAQVKPVAGTEKAKSESPPKHSTPVSKTVTTPVSHDEDDAAMSKAVPESDDLKSEPAWEDVSGPDNSVEYSDPELPEYQSEPELEPGPSDDPYASDLSNEVPEENAENPQSNSEVFVDKKDLTDQTQSRVDSQTQPIPNDAAEDFNPAQTGDTSKSNDVTVIEKEIIP